jgi:hypothetical protein
MTDRTKIRLVRVLTAATIVTAAWAALHVMVASTGFAIAQWWGGWAVGGCGLIALASAILAAKTPRQIAPLVTTGVVTLVHGVFWGWLLVSLRG